MRFPSRILGVISDASPAQQDRHSARQCRSPIGLERLESRDLMTALAGVSVSNYTLFINAPKASGNVAVISIDPSNHNVQLTLNGQSEEFSPTKVYHVTYIGGRSGGDTVTDNTSLALVACGYGQNNNFTGGTSYNYVWFYGDYNTFTGQAGSVSDVFENGYAHDTINSNGGIVQIY